MFSELLLKIPSAKNLSTYRVGLLQAKAYRSLKKHTGASLKPYGINSLEWALLGSLSEFPEGVKSIDIAELLGVEPPFVTTMVDVLEKQGLLKRTAHASDRRAKIIVLTAKGKELVPQIEKILRAEFKNLLKDTSIAEVLSYTKVLTKIVSNA